MREEDSKEFEELGVESDLEEQLEDADGEKEAIRRKLAQEGSVELQVELGFDERTQSEDGGVLR